jgi:hypothetical protein
MVFGNLGFGHLVLIRLVVQVKKMSVLINFLLQNTNLVSVLSKICPNRTDTFRKLWLIDWLKKYIKWKNNPTLHAYENLPQKIINFIIKAWYKSFTNSFICFFSLSFSANLAGFSREELLVMTVTEIVSQLIQAHEQSKDVNLNRWGKKKLFGFG